MIFEIIGDIVKLSCIVAALFLSLSYFITKKRPGLQKDLEKRRLVILFVLVLVVLAFKLSEDVIGGESGPFDKAVLLFIHSHIPASLTPFFTAVTFTGSAKFLLPFTVLVTLALLLSRHNSEALLLAVSQLSAVLFILIIKTVVARDRPELWETDWYWGASFPSGHTLGVAAFATAVTLCILRIRPGTHRVVIALAFLWIFSVGFSRLVLGVHWPTDVLTAACIGTFLPLLLKAIIHLHKT